MCIYILIHIYICNIPTSLLISSLQTGLAVTRNQHGLVLSREAHQGRHGEEETFSWVIGSLADRRPLYGVRTWQCCRLLRVGEYGVWSPPRYGKLSSENDDEPVDFGVSCFQTNANGVVGLGREISGWAGDVYTLMNLMNYGSEFICIYIYIILIIL